MCFLYAGGSIILEESSDDEPLIEIAGKSRGGRLQVRVDRTGARTPQRSQRAASREDDSR